MGHESSYLCNIRGEKKLLGQIEITSLACVFQVGHIPPLYIYTFTPRITEAFIVFLKNMCVDSWGHGGLFTAHF